MCMDSNKNSSILSPNAQEWSPPPHAQNPPFHPFQCLPHVIFAPASPPAAAPPPPHRPYFHPLYFPSCYRSFIPFGPPTRPPQPFYHSAPVTFQANGCYYEAALPFPGGGKNLKKVEMSIVKGPRSIPVAFGRTHCPARLKRTRMINRQVWAPKALNFDDKFAGGGGASPSTPPRDHVLPSKELSSRSKTTVMIRNIPNQLRRDYMLEFLDQYCKEYSLEYDFLYLPMDFRKENNLGYAFVNFTSGEYALKLKEILQDHRWDSVKTDKGLLKSKKICEITWAKIQGKEELVKRFQNTSFACNKLEFLPVVLDPPRDGSGPQLAPPVIIGRLQNRAFRKIH